MALFRKAVSEAVGGASETAAKESLRIGHFAGAAGIATAAGIMKAQMDYTGDIEELTNLYKNEIAAQLGKSKKEVTKDDLKLVATGNRTLNEELAKAKRERNLNMGVISSASFASAGIALQIVTALGVTGSGLGPIVASIAIGMLVYTAIKTPIEMLGKKIFGMDKKSVGERIADIHKEHEKGKVITRERVFSVFVAANPKLAEFIQRHTGKSYEKLKVAEKIQLTEAIGSQIGVGRLTDDINQGRMQATELAFAVDGRASGVEESLGDAPKTMMGKIKEKVEDAVGYHPANDKPAGFSFQQRERDRRSAPKQTGITV